MTTTNGKGGMLESIVIFTVSYKSESKFRKRKREEMFDIKCLRKVLGVRVMERIRSRGVR